MQNYENVLNKYADLQELREIEIIFALTIFAVDFFDIGLGWILPDCPPPTTEINYFTMI